MGRIFECNTPCKVQVHSDCAQLDQSILNAMAVLPAQSQFTSMTKISTGLDGITDLFHATVFPVEIGLSQLLFNL